MKLEPSEAELVQAILAEQLRVFRQEIAGTEDYALREQMKGDEESITHNTSRLIDAQSGKVAAWRLASARPCGRSSRRQG